MSVGVDNWNADGMVALEGCFTLCEQGPGDHRGKFLLSQVTEPRPFPVSLATGCSEEVSSPFQLKVLRVRVVK